jgi:hypothetical protein
MKELVLDLINSYEQRVMTVENLINNAFESALDSEEGLTQAYDQSQKLKENLRERLVHNCSLRRKDFEAYSALVFNRIEKKKTEIENERKLIREVLKTYLTRQKELVAALKEQLAQFSLDASGKNNLETLITNIKVSQKEEGEQTFALLSDIQFRLQNFRLELADLNSNLKRVLERGELLDLEDFRQLQATLAQERRKAERIDRQKDVERLLAHFSRERQGINR